jgi:hypothetical protein
MADQDLSLTFSVDSSAATDGIAQVNAALEQTATDAQAAGTAAAAAGQAVVDGTKAAVPAVNDIATAMAAADAASTKLGDNQGIRGLPRQILAATDAVRLLKEQIAAAQAAGAPIDPTAVAKLQALQTQIDASTMKLGVMRAEMQNISLRSMEMGESWKAAATSGGSLQGMMTKLAETSTGTGGSLAKFGLTMLGVEMAFKAGYAAGTMIDNGLKAIGVDLSALHSPADMAENIVAKFANTVMTGAKNSAFLTDALKLVGVNAADAAKWTAAVAAATGQYGDVLEPVTFKVNALMKAHQQGAQDLLAVEAALKKLGVAWESAGQYTNTTTQEIKLMSKALTDASIAGQDQLETITLNSKALQGLKARLDEEGISYDTLDPKLKTAILLSQGLADAHAKHTAQIALLQGALTTLNPTITTTLNTLEQENQKVTLAGGNVLKLAQDHDQAVQSLVAFAKQTGLSSEEVVKFIQKQTLLRDAMKDATDQGVVQMEIALSKLGVSLDDAAAKTETFAEKQSRLAAATAEANKEFDAQTAKINARNAAIDAATTAQSNFDAAQANGIAFEGQATEVLMTVTAATQAQTDALVALLKAQNAYTDAVANTLTVAKGWNDYLATLADSYKTGAIDLIQYKQSLEDFQTQLEQTFSGATGNAKKQLDAMTQAIQTLINTAGAGNAGMGDTSITGQLNNAFNKP